MGLYEDMSRRHSPVVKDALTRSCRICEAPKGQYCTNICNGQLNDRLVHLDRTSA